MPEFRRRNNDFLVLAGIPQPRDLPLHFTLTHTHREGLFKIYCEFFVMGRWRDRKHEQSRCGESSLIFRAESRSDIWHTWTMSEKNICNVYIIILKMILNSNKEKDWSRTLLYKQCMSLHNSNLVLPLPTSQSQTLTNTGQEVMSLNACQAQHLIWFFAAIRGFCSPHGIWLCIPGWCNFAVWPSAWLVCISCRISHLDTNFADSNDITQTHSCCWTSSHIKRTKMKRTVGKADQNETDKQADSHHAFFHMV